MQDVRIDPTAKLAYVGAGSVWGQVDEAAIKHG
jgi:FAD/FMN-containing dehydrogenase